ncbi:MAG: hypothetical protein J5J06_12035 [Phycisphaerae bacterium]|nr:hypothetical protein [Phycisphaerae bacterium]
MKQGTLYAKRIKKLFESVRSSNKVDVPTEPDDPLRRLAIAILSESDGSDTAEAIVERLTSNLVGWNEVRVSTVEELLRAAGESGSATPVPYFERLVRALQAVYDKEHNVSLDRLKSIGRREARQYLEALDGVGPYAAASVTLWSLGGHGIPVDDGILDVLRSEELVHPTADRAEVQAFLERNIPAAQAQEFSLVMRKYAAGRKKSEAPRTTTKASKRAGRSTKKRAVRRTRAARK